MRTSLLLLFVSVVFSSACTSVSTDFQKEENMDGVRSVQVYVVDSYIDVKHPNLLNIESSQYDWRHESSATETDVVDGLAHGTSVALAITAYWKNLLQSEFQLHSAVVASENSVDTQAVIRALEFVSEKESRVVVNFSIGSLGPPPKVVLESLQRLHDDENILVIIAAGNQGKNLDHNASFCGAKDINFLCVGSLGHDNSLTRTSNFGKLVDVASKSNLNVHPEIDEIVYDSNGQLNIETDGTTSIAAGYVSGFAAMYWNANPQLAAADVVVNLCNLARRTPVGGVRCGSI